MLIGPSIVMPHIRSVYMFIETVFFPPVSQVEEKDFLYDTVVRASYYFYNFMLQSI